ncbi:Rid family detoxifying hydrolase [Bifidobacterium actinocoloniiforme]|uniref:Rid family detoxifying hydrolase n=1 Tax=Bifidobacterium actinocoloniiforme TaxID=638619 RepID=UPI000529CDBB|nr:Rid family detoxifying hydrolase [Bifidobacterium actinocoloniiforme]AKV56203.1 endoribonuclease L-PSP [Bifidobacterium actinocoloniiforme DSM 22766]
MKKLPEAIGPYSSYRTQGRFLITSGQLPLNPETNRIEATSVHDQALQSLANIGAILSNEGLEWSDVIKLTVFMDDLSVFSEVNEAFSQALKEPFPARTAIEVSALPMQSHIEIEAIALGGQG